jgi:recombination protein RecR
MYPKTFEDLIEYLSKLPGVGRKSAERFAYQILEFDTEEIYGFIETLKDTKTKIKKCEVCHNMCEGEYCNICVDENRDKKIICIVQNSKDIISMEKIQGYNGVYHVLDGLISTSKGIMPNDINIESLLDRINEKTKEVIIALETTKDGEVTSLYLAKLLEKKDLLVTRLAYGLPMGGRLDYADELTLTKAIENRLIIKNNSEGDNYEN